MQAVLAIAVVSAVHGVIALVWIAGLHHLAGPLSLTMRASLLRMALALPPLVTVLHLLAPPSFGLFRSTRLAEALLEAGWSAYPPLALLLGGSTLIFVAQELWPLFRERSPSGHGALSQDARLDEALDSVWQRARDLSLVRRRMRPHIRCRETAAIIAALHGLWRPQIVISRRLLTRLDDDELQSIVAHEVAHLLRSDNAHLLLLWLFRALQASSPAALICFRLLLEARELSCDDLARKLTQKSGALASALIKAHPASEKAEQKSRFKRARLEVLRRAELASTRARIEALLAWRQRPDAAGVASRALACAAMAALLWSMF